MSSKSSYLFAALSFLFLTSGYVDTYSSLCSSSSCGNEVSIRYPFWVENTTTTHRYCGYPGFGLRCSDNGQPIITLPSDTYYVTDINYGARRLTLVDIDVVNQYCPRARHNVTLGTLPLSYSSLDLNLTFYFNCSISYEVSSSNRIGCLDSSEISKRSYVFVKGNESHGYDWSVDCEEKVVVVVKEDEIDEGELVSGFGGAMNKGFAVDWGRARDCAECEGSDGYCGYNQSTSETLCFCKDGQIATKRCNKGGSKCQAQRGEG